MTKTEWLVEAARKNETVGVVEIRSGLLVNVGNIWESRSGILYFAYEGMTGAPMRVQPELEGKDEDGENEIVPMTPEHERRWKMIQACREIPWNAASTETLEKVLEAFTCREIPWNAASTETLEKVLEAIK